MTCFFAISLGRGAATALYWTPKALSAYRMGAGGRRDAGAVFLLADGPGSMGNMFSRHAGDAGAAPLYTHHHTPSTTTTLCPLDVYRGCALLPRRHHALHAFRTSAVKSSAMRCNAAPLQQNNTSSVSAISVLLHGSYLSLAVRLSRRAEACDTNFSPLYLYLHCVFMRVRWRRPQRRSSCAALQPCAEIWHGGGGGRAQGGRAVCLFVCTFRICRLPVSS
jgi:hypothetical protein